MTVVELSCGWGCMGLALGRGCISTVVSLLLKDAEPMGFFFLNYAYIQTEPAAVKTRASHRRALCVSLTHIAVDYLV